MHLDLCCDEIGEHILCFEHFEHYVLSTLWACFEHVLNTTHGWAQQDRISWSTAPWPLLWWNRWAHFAPWQPPMTERGRIISPEGPHLVLCCDKCCALALAGTFHYCLPYSLTNIINKCDKWYLFMSRVGNRGKCPKVLVHNQHRRCLA